MDPAEESAQPTKKRGFPPMEFWAALITIGYSLVVVLTLLKPTLPAGVFTALGNDLPKLSIPLMCAVFLSENALKLMVTTAILAIAFILYLRTPRGQKLGAQIGWKGYVLSILCLFAAISLVVILSGAPSVSDGSDLVR